MGRPAQELIQPIDGTRKKTEQDINLAIELIRAHNIREDQLYGQTHQIIDGTNEIYAKVKIYNDLALKILDETKNLKSKDTYTPSDEALKLIEKLREKGEDLQTETILTEKNIEVLTTQIETRKAMLQQEGQTKMLNFHPLLNEAFLITKICQFILAQQLELISRILRRVVQVS